MSILGETLGVFSSCSFQVLGLLLVIVGFIGIAFQPAVGIVTLIIGGLMISLGVVLGRKSRRR